MKSIDLLSKTSLRIKLYFNVTPLGSATGVVIDRGEKLYLVTNWHVVTAKHPLTEDPLDKKTNGYPNRLEVNYYSQHKKEWTLCSLNLYRENEIREDKKKWIEHPHSMEKDRLDVILLPIGKKEEYPDIPIFNLNLSKVNVKLFPALTVSVIGFPLNEDSGGKDPVWVTGFIASEPSKNIDKYPRFFINASGYKGLSGSPVIVLTNFYQSEEGSINLSAGYVVKFIGIYSGRITGKEGDGLALCHVWKPRVIEEIYQHSLGQDKKINQPQLMS